VDRITRLNEENVLLLPKTIEFYQDELTRMLEEEKYAEAADTIRFLLGCGNVDPEYKQEWLSILHWLAESFPGIALEKKFEEAEDDEADSEEDMLKELVREKSARDANYADRLLSMLSPGEPAERQLAALEQLSCLDRRAVGAPLVRWLRETKLHPLIQFRGLQTLKKIGETDMIEIRKLGQKVQISIAEVPLSYEQFPDRLRGVSAAVRAAMEADGTGMADIADSIWRELLPFYYGTAIYDELAHEDDRGLRVWSAALHAMAEEAVYGGSGPERSMDRYRLAEEDDKLFQRAQQVIRLFMAVSAPSEL
jgi:hypothetical protein